MGASQGFKAIGLIAQLDAQAGATDRPQWDRQPGSPHGQEMEDTEGVGMGVRRPQVKMLIL